VSSHRRLEPRERFEAKRLHVEARFDHPAITSDGVHGSAAGCRLS
jgi:hypothetical protein